MSLKSTRGGFGVVMVFVVGAMMLLGLPHNRILLGGIVGVFIKGGKWDRLNYAHLFADCGQDKSAFEIYAVRLVVGYFSWPMERQSG